MRWSRREAVARGLASGLWVALGGLGAAQAAGGLRATRATGGLGASGSGEGHAGLAPSTRPGVQLGPWLSAPHPQGGEVRLDPAGNALSRWREGAQVWRYAAAGPQAGRLNAPQALAVTVDGRVVVANTGNDALLVFGADGQPVAVWGGPGAGPGRFARPRGLACDAGGRLWVADTHNHRLQVLSAEGRWLRSLDAAGDLNGPAALAWVAGHLWVAELGAPRLVRLDARTGTVRSAVVLDAPARALATAPNGLFAAVGAQVLRLDLQGRVRARWNLGAEVLGLSASPDAQGLRARVAPHLRPHRAALVELSA